MIFTTMNNALEVFLMLVLCLVGIVDGMNEASGQRFIFGFLDVSSSSPPQIYILPQTHEQLNVSISMPGYDGFTPIHRTITDTESVTTIDLPNDVRINQNISYKGVLLETSHDVVVYGINSVNGSKSHIFIIHPTAHLATKYILRPKASYSKSGLGERAVRTKLGLIGITDNTTVFIHMPNDRRHKVEMMCLNNIIGSGDSCYLPIDTYMTLQLEVSDDMTGVQVTANHPIVLLNESGIQSTVRSSMDITKSNTRENVKQQDNLSIDVMNNDLPETDKISANRFTSPSWGKSFATIPISKDNNEVFKVFASVNDTRVEVKKKAERQEFRLFENEQAEIHVNPDDYINIESDKPVLLLHYVIVVFPQYRQYSSINSPNDHYSHYQNSFTLVVPPMEDQRHHYIFTSSNQGPRHGVNLIVAHDDPNTPDSFRNGKPFHISSYPNLIQGLHRNFSALRLPGKFNNYNLSHQSDYQRITAVSYGFQDGGIADYKTLRVSTVPSILLPKLQPNSNKPHKSTSKPSTLPKQYQEAKTVTLLPVYTQSHTGSLDFSQINSSINKGKDFFGNPKILSSNKDMDGINEAAVDPHVAYPGILNNSQTEGISPAILAVIFSLSAAIFFVIFCILGFVMVEYVRSREGGFWQTKVHPFDN